MFNTGHCVFRFLTARSELKERENHGDLARYLSRTFMDLKSSSLLLYLRIDNTIKFRNTELLFNLKFVCTKILTIV